MTKKQAENLMTQKNHQLNMLENLQGKKRLEIKDLIIVLKYEIENLEILKGEIEK